MLVRKMTKKTYYLYMRCNVSHLFVDFYVFNDLIIIFKTELSLMIQK